MSVKEVPIYNFGEIKLQQLESNVSQLLAELIAAIELNDFKQIKGAYIIGENWNFVILEKLKVNSYQYFISHTFNATHFSELQQIYKNLRFIKQEIIDIQKTSL